MSLRDHLACIVLSFVPHDGNSHREKGILYALLVAVVALLVLRSIGWASFEDPHVEGFVGFGVETIKLGAAYQFGSIHKSERFHRKKVGA